METFQNQVINSTTTESHRERLAGVLNEYRQFSAELAGLEQKIASAKANEDAALNDHSADEAELADRLTKAQNLQRVHGSRLDHKRTQQSESLKRLEALFPAAEGQLRLGCGQLLESRSEILKERILKVIGLAEAPRGMHGLADLVEASPLIQAVRDCMPGANVFIGRSIETKAQELLTKFAKLETEKGKVI